MLRQSRIKALKQIDQKGFKGIDFYGRFNFDYSIFQSEVKLTLSNKMFLELRNLMLMSICPKKLDAAESEQAAYLRAAISRENNYFLEKKKINFILVGSKDRN